MLQCFLSRSPSSKLQLSVLPSCRTQAACRCAMLACNHHETNSILFPNALLLAPRAEPGHELAERPPLPSCETLKRCLGIFSLFLYFFLALRSFVGQSRSG